MLYKRSTKPGSHWWVRFSIKGVEIRQSSGSDRKELAEAFEQSLREAIWREQNLGEEIHTWGDATARWLKEKAHKRSLERDRQAIRRLRIRDDRELQELGPDAGGEDDDSGTATPGARELAVLRSILRAASKWGWLERAPQIEIPRAETHEPRWITQAQEKKLLKELPPHAIKLAKFGAATGLRSGNIFRLKWEAVDLKRRVLIVGARDAKSRKSGGFSLSDDACAILRGQQGAHPTYVFTDHLGRAPIKSIKTTWLKAVKRAGLEGFRFHDLRHTWAARHTLAGTPPIVLKELGGWSSLAMVERYAHLNPGHLSDWANNSKVRTKTGTRRKPKKRKSL